MFLLCLLRYALHLLVPLSLLLSSYLYLYPAFHLCAFPSSNQNQTAPSPYLTTLLSHTPFPSSEKGTVAPFRLLALGDPQLEGDSSIDYVESASFPTLKKLWKDSGLKSGSEHSGFLQRLRHSLHDIIDFYLDDIPKALGVYRKRFDHFGNDYYLGHIYRTLHWWTNPTHVTVLGDLVGSQWIDDEEFNHRGWRFWNRVFKGGVKVPEELFSQPADDFQGTQTLGEDAELWKKRIINVAGNHDIGYAGDISPERMERFTRVFGKANYEMRFHMPINSTLAPEEGEETPIPELRIVVLNDMNLDTPASSREVQDETYDFLNKVITTSRDVDRAAHFTMVLTHIPLYKEAGICVDGPFFDFFDGQFDNGVKEQNHLSRDASKGFLEGIFGMNGNENAPGHGYGRHGVILNGHDHEGCNVYHYINQSAPMEREWQATTWPKALEEEIVGGYGLPGLREITVRSMMGGFAGNAGLMSLWFDEESWEWQFEFANCGLGTQHIWWIVHIVDLITIGVGIVYGGLFAAHKLQLIGSSISPQKLKGLAKNPTKLRENGQGKAGQKATLTKKKSLLEITEPQQGSRSIKKKKSGLLKDGSPNGSTTTKSL